MDPMHILMMPDIEKNSWMNTMLIQSLPEREP